MLLFKPYGDLHRQFRHPEANQRYTTGDPEPAALHSSVRVVLAAKREQLCRGQLPDAHQSSSRSRVPNSGSLFSFGCIV